METLVQHARETHETLAEYLARARVCPIADPADPADERAGDPVAEHHWAVETFLEAASWHTAAVTAVIVPAVRVRLPDGHERARDFIRQSRRLELALNQATLKLRGTSYAARRSWESVWTDVEREFEATWAIEMELLTHLVDAYQDGDPNWHVHLDEAEMRAVARPYPRISHQGMRTHVVRSLALRRRENAERP